MLWLSTGLSAASSSPTRSSSSSSLFDEEPVCLAGTKLSTGGVGAPQAAGPGDGPAVVGAEERVAIGESELPQSSRNAGSGSSSLSQPEGAAAGGAAREAPVPASGGASTFSLFGALSLSRARLGFASFLGSPAGRLQSEVEWGELATICSRASSAAKGSSPPPSIASPPLAAQPLKGGGLSHPWVWGG
eukprot:CAMPEP_0175674216 /NCGR_PEP_ID=MMETSP0097-20121207/21602_1 /TAXON_ID=311494 /ORGANISM="Alexandrium monilatum, Strain CCMP3105" /LENGTH=188 /DNA_ID=CAMNT_0016980897 /DNA_START=229 /DNA_END=791 /DNA_ORIENTATION=-